MVNTSYYQYLGDTLLSLASYRYEKLVYRLEEVLKKLKMVNTRITDPFPKLIVVEGDRCSGKNTIIEQLQREISTLHILSRNKCSLAWSKLNEKKRNCYFSHRDAITSTLLWYSDLASRIAESEFPGDDALFLSNRYTYSIDYCILSGLRAEENYQDVRSIKRLMNQLHMFFPVPDLVAILDVDELTQSDRLFVARGRIFSDEEKAISRLVRDLFLKTTGENIIHCDSRLPIEYIVINIHTEIERRITA